MINLLVALPVGNAVRVILLGGDGASRRIILRNATGTFSGPTDANSVPVMDSPDAVSALDSTGLVNGTTYYYQDYAYINGAWVAGTVMSAVPASSLVDVSVDALSMLRDRLDAGLQAEVAAGRLTPQSGAIKVLTAPPTFEDTKWPVVTVHLQSDTPQVRAIGEDVAGFPLGLGFEEGWMSQTQINVIGWTLNPDERIALRMALKRIIVGNLPVFDDAGFEQIEFSQNDTEDFNSYNAPIYQSICTFSCLSPNAIASSYPAIAEVDFTNVSP